MNSPTSNRRSIVESLDLIRQRVGCRHLRLWFVLALVGLAPITSAQQAVTTYWPLLPKYEVLGVLYAPPGDYQNSFVSYDQSTAVGSMHSQSFTSSNTQTKTTSSTSSFSLMGLFGSSTTISDQWINESQTQNTSSIAVTTTTDNKLSVTAPFVGGSVGVDHDYDLIVLWLNPATNTTLTYNPSGTPIISFSWQGFQYNGCEPGDTADPQNFYQQISGCDPLNGLQPDIVLVPVWCLKNPYSQQQLPTNPASTCADWWVAQGSAQQEFLSRYWDQNAWGTDPTTGVSLGPGLTVHDLADILRADPYVTQTLVADNYQKNPTTGAAENPYTSPCHPTYGLDYIPDNTETIPDPSKFSAPYAGTWPADYCGTPGEVMARQDNQGVTIFYQTGVDQNHSFERSKLTSNAMMATDTHTFTESETTTNTYNFSGMIGLALDVVAPIAGELFSAVGFNMSTSSGTGFSYTDTSSYSDTNTIGTNSTAAYQIDGPAGTDNYSGPGEFAVYDDNVYGTYSFWSSQETLNPPTLPTSSPIGVKMTAAGSVKCATATTCNFGTVTVGKSSGAITVTLTNNSPYQMTMTSPSLSFSDIAPDQTSGYTQLSSFVIVSGSDLCAGKVLAAGKTCTVKIKFTPRLVDAPNTEQASYPVAAYMVAAGTEGIPFFSGGACASSFCSSVLVTNTVLNVTGPGAETFTAVSGTAVPAAATCSGIEPSCDVGATLTPPALDFADGASKGTQVYTFKNYASTSASISSIQLTDTTDYSITSDNCTGHVVPSLGTCMFTLVYAASGPGPTRDTKVSVLSGTTTLAYAGAAALSPVILRPTTYAAVSGKPPYTSPQLAFDDNLGTAATAAVHAPNNVVTGAGETWSGWSAISGSPTSVVLYIVWDTTCGGGGSCGTGVSYSASNGVQGVTTDHPTTETTETFTLPTNVDLTTLQVQGAVSCYGGQPGFGSGENCTQNLYEAWVQWSN